ncbi:MAG: sugar ABC transporter ATP-binding protein [Anaerolineales bacterium]|nr:sugar ABC transporter ATP-binding protein [Anaerolineales bacterium]
MAEVTDLLLMQGISKTFPGVHALANVDFSLHRGEIHALMGENGAGKSTLIKVLTGVERQNEGIILFDGKEIQPRSPLQAQALGISTVYQEVNLCPNLSVAENILLGREPHRFGGVDWRALNRRASEILTWLDVDIDVRQSLGAYPVAIQQMVAISRALEISAKILILDEPTSSLSAYETEKLFEVMRKLKSEGMGIVFITHFLDQVYAVADRITVLRNGQLVGTFATAALPRYELVAKMIGRNLTELEDMSRLKEASGQELASEPTLQTRGLGHIGTLHPIDLDLYSGEVLGFAGLLGSGRTEVANLLFGVDKADSGTLTVNGKPVEKPSPLHSIQIGRAYCPEDRKADGIVGDLSVRENIILAIQASRGWFKYLERDKQVAIAERYIQVLNISTPSTEQLVKNLSGGNQQKVILARWLATEPNILILDEPTRGIDIGAKAEIQKLVLTLATEGKACIFISSELDEVLRTSHRVIVMRDHAKVAELVGNEIDEEKIMQTIAGETP